MKKLMIFSIFGIILLMGISYAYITSNVSVSLDSKLYDGEVTKSSSAFIGYTYEVKNVELNNASYNSVCVRTKEHNAGCKLISKDDKIDSAVKEIISRYLNRKTTTSQVLEKGTITITKDLGGLKE